MFEESGLDAYQHTQLEARAAAADPHHLVLMLIEGFLDELSRVEGHIQAKQFERKGRAVTKCLDILSGLDTALDREKGGAVADDLHRLYDYCGRQLFEVSLNNDTSGLAIVRQVMTDLKDGWQALAAA
ncbi:flagellar export chaperone FliS [Gallaecimonas kandeliae]|uniref:flagellar export chaperone FliS n=1 Tax=Gallaecimonas kandeliae TaxID=3029055 RepID=UPI002648D30D|nr:flagellar export chaperone FliS [Gallaecimonas kandeliae]WKE66542.1 flagellar export chaperone FliS [Gallaecimonas kandeliae]